VIRRWARASRTASTDPRGIVFSAVAAPRNGWIALLRSAHGERLVGALDDRIGGDAALLAELLELAGGAQENCLLSTASEAVDSLQHWLESERAATLAGGPDILVSRHRRASYARLAGLESAPRARRVALDTIAGEAHRLSAARMGIEREQRLLAASGDPDLEKWLSQMASFATSGADRASARRDDEAPVALLLLVGP
jgi:hypothetical protein